MEPRWNVVQPSLHILGYESVTELQQSPPDQVFYDPEEGQATIRRLMQEGSFNDVEIRLKRKDGSPVWVLHSACLVPDEAGRPALVEGTVIDITSRKQADEFRRLVHFSVECASFAVLWLDSGGRILYTNEAACQQLGYSKPELPVHDDPRIESGFPWRALPIGLERH